MSKKKKIIPKDRQEIGDRLRQVRELAGYKPLWTLVAPHLGQPKNKAEEDERRNKERSVQRFESGQKKPDYEYLLFWSNKGYSIDWILTGKGQPKLTEGGVSYRIVSSTISDLLDRIDIDEAIKKYILDEVGDMKAKNVQMMETNSELQEENRQLRKDKDELVDLIEQLHKANQSQE